MISIKKLRKNKDSFKEKLALKQDNTDLDLILSLDEKLRELKTSSSQMRAERNSASEAIGQAKKAGEDATEAINNMRVLGENLKKLENDLHDVSDQMNELLYKIPTPPPDSSPQGLDESDNIEIRSMMNITLTFVHVTMLFDICSRICVHVYSIEWRFGSDWQKRPHAITHLRHTSVLCS